MQYKVLKMFLIIIQVSGYQRLKFYINFKASMTLLLN